MVPQELAQRKGGWAVQGANLLVHVYPRRHQRRHQAVAVSQGGGVQRAKPRRPRQLTALRVLGQQQLGAARVAGQQCVEERKGRGGVLGAAREHHCLPSASRQAAATELVRIAQAPGSAARWCRCRKRVEGLPTTELAGDQTGVCGAPVE